MAARLRVSRRILVLTSVAIGVALPILAAEIALWFLPVQRGIQVAKIDMETPTFSFEPNRAFVWSRDWDMVMVNRGRINNAGFVNDQDYVPHAPTPLLAVIGDSYVEAVMLPFADTFHGRLAAAVAARGRVYSFAASGAPLSQYLAWAEYARQTYRPAGLVIAVVGNDFDESLSAYKVGPGFHLYEKRGDGTLALRRHDYRPNPWTRLLLRSALVRYAVYHLSILHHVTQTFGIAALAAESRYLGNTDAAAGAERTADSEQAVQAFLRDLPGKSGLPPSQILFIVDGLRYPAEDPSTRAAHEASYFARMRHYFLSESSQRGYGIIDMDTAFFAHWRAHGERFDWPRDGHWNALGHRLAAEQIARSDLLGRVFGGR